MSNGSLRSPSAALGVVGLGSLLLGLAVRQVGNADIWWQLATGQLIVETGALPEQDPFSYTAAGRPWIELRWLFCLLARALHGLAGMTGLGLAQVVIVAAAWLAVAWPSRPVAVRPVGLLVLALGMLAAAPRYLPRPELVSFLLLPIFLVELERVGTGRSRGLALLPLQVVWVNTHTLFVLGPLAAWAWAAGSLIRRERRGPLLGLAAGVTMATLLNPWGLRGALFPLELLGELNKESLAGRWIGEFASPLDEPWQPALVCAALLAILALGSFARRGRHADPARLCLLLAGLVMALLAVRNVALLGLVGAWVALRNLHDAPPAAPARPALQAGLGVLLAALGAGLATGRVEVANGRPGRPGLGLDPSSTPAAAVRFLLDNGVRGPLFHALSDGGYLIWAAPRYPVFMDGRLEVYGPDILDEYLHAAVDWDDLAERHRIQVVMANHEHLAPLVRKLRRDRRFVLVHLDARELVYVRDVPEHAALIARARIDPRRAFQPPGPEPHESPRALAAADPWYSRGMARAFLQIGGLENAARYLDRVLEARPDDPWALEALGAVRLALDQPQRAQRLLRRLPPDRRAPVVHLAQALRAEADGAATPLY